jgi:hypothetical protein
MSSRIAESAGFVEVVRRDCRSGEVEYRQGTCLDIDDNGYEYKQGSFNVEYRKRS